MIVGGRTSNGERDERARGLRKISASGRQDNTGFGIAVSEEDGKIIVEQVGSENSRVTIQVPNSATVKVTHNTQYGSKIKVKDFSGELDISLSYNSVELENTTGPIAVNTIYGTIVAKYAQEPTNDIRLHSTYSDVDLSIPAATKANVQLSTSYGSMYTAFDINVKSNLSSNDCGGCGTGDLRGTINGGSDNLISITATYDNIYLREN
ncbi:MAG: DUF4097 family beta strand repeat-containing protein [Bacteroidota bacterium]